MSPGGCQTGIFRGGYWTLLGCELAVVTGFWGSAVPSNLMK